MKIPDPDPTKNVRIRVPNTGKRGEKYGFNVHFNANQDETHYDVLPDQTFISYTLFSINTYLGSKILMHT